MFFGEKILMYWDDILRDLGELIAIPSVCGAAEGDYPFGKEAARAIDTALRQANSYGLTTKNVDYYACHAEIGQGDENAVVMAHLDVVPEGEGWDTPPYVMTLRDGFAFGRGVSDNKGAAVIAMHCLRALKDVPGKRKLRVIMGSAEEIGMVDMPYYFAREQAPTMGFTPDSAYGICNCEKGILHFTVNGPADSPIVTHFCAGTVVNAVPYKAEAEILCNDSEFAILQEAAYKLDGTFVLTRTTLGAQLLSKGVASHAANPSNGKNAASSLIDLLYSVFGNKIGTLLTFAQKKIGLCSDGSNMGVAAADTPSGALTFNLGIVHVTPTESRLQVDIRYPATHEGAALVENLRTETEAFGLCFASHTIQAPLYLPADSPLCTLLKDSYKAVMNEECSVFSMGGGTYARQMNGKGVAFGASFPSAVCREHNSNERINLEEFKLHAQICLEAMWRMYTYE